MPEFATVQQNAKSFPRRLTRRIMDNQSCFTFFVGIVFNPNLDDALIIESMADSLESKYDQELLDFFKRLNKESAVYMQRDGGLEFDQFKVKILIGIYLVKWFKYNNTIGNSINKTIINLFQEDLDLPGMEETPPELFGDSLDALKDYCSFVYANQHKNEVYERLNNQLGKSIQVDIYTVRNTVKNSKANSDSSWYGVYTGIMQSIGL